MEEMSSPLLKANLSLYALAPVIHLPSNEETHGLSAHLLWVFSTSPELREPSQSAFKHTPDLALLKITQTLNSVSFPFLLSLQSPSS